MPYVAIKSYPKDEEQTKRVIERINEVLKEEWHCRTLPPMPTVFAIPYR